MENHLQSLKLKVEKARTSVKKAKMMLKTATGEKDIALRKKLLKAANTRLKKAENKYLSEKAEYIRSKRETKWIKVRKFFSRKTKTAPKKDVGEKKPATLSVKKVFVGVGTATASIGTVILTYILYKNFNESKEEMPVPDQV